MHVLSAPVKWTRRKRFTPWARFSVLPPAQLGIPTMSLAMAKALVDASAATDLNGDAVVPDL